MQRKKNMELNHFFQPIPWYPIPQTKLQEHSSLIKYTSKNNALFQNSMHKALEKKKKKILQV